MRSFRTRLIIAFVALFAAISVAVSFVGLLLREQQIRGLFDRELRNRAEVVHQKIDRLPVRNDDSLRGVVGEMSDNGYFRDFYVQIFDTKGTDIAKSENLGNGGVSLNRPLEDTTLDNIIRDRKVMPGTFDRGGPAELRGVRLRFAGDGKDYVVVVATNPLFITESVNALRWLFLGGNIGGLLAAGGAAWLVTGAMARRIEAIKKQVKTLGPDELDRRIASNGREDEISELAGHLNDMLDRLKGGFETQERFIHDASHELKTPVATVQAEAQALMMGEASREELLEFVRSTNDEMRRLGRLIEALLLLTRSNEAKIAHRLKTMDMTEITIAAIRHLSGLATDHRVHLNLIRPKGEHGSVPIRCDPELLEAMMSNLIRNAIRFSPQRSEVRITLSAVDHAAELKIEDAGPGIPADILPRMFDRYFQSSQHRVRRGAGLGLAIATTVVNLHGGSIAASNRTDTHGACFTVRLPLHRTPRSEAGTGE